MIRIELKKTLRSKAGSFTLDLSFEAPEGRIVAVTGPSGSGKTTLLRLLAGLLRPEGGRVELGGEVWYDGDRSIDIPAWKRSVGFVFQEYALFPNLTVKENVAYGSRNRTLVEELLETGGLAAQAGLKPDKLSGGQKQRTAFLRALAREPRVLLLDEPLSALNAELRSWLQEKLLEQHERPGVPVFLVSHDLAEIFKLADQVLYLEEGRLKAQGSPEELFLERDTAFPDVFVGEVVSVSEPLAGLRSCLVAGGSGARKILLSGDRGAAKGDRLLVRKLKA